MIGPNRGPLDPLDWRYGCQQRGRGNGRNLPTCTVESPYGDDAKRSQRDGEESERGRREKEGMEVGESQREMEIGKDSVETISTHTHTLYYTLYNALHYARYYTLYTGWVNAFHLSALLCSPLLSGRPYQEVGQDHRKLPAGGGNRTGDEGVGGGGAGEAEGAVLPALLRPWVLAGVEDAADCDGYDEGGEEEPPSYLE